MALADYQTAHSPVPGEPMARPGRHPRPHADLAARNPIVREWIEPLFRIHRLIHDPLHFGKSPSNRFDAPSGEYGVLYAGVDEHAAFIETLGQGTGIRAVTAGALRERGLTRLTPSKPLKLIDLASGGGLARIGADARLIAGEHQVSREWSKALRAHPAAADGILYPARHDPARLCCALFGHCEDFLVTDELGSLGGPGLARLAGSILDHYQFGLI